MRQWNRDCITYDNYWSEWRQHVYCEDALNDLLCCAIKRNYASPDRLKIKAKLVKQERQQEERKKAFLAMIN